MARSPARFHQARSRVAGSRAICPIPLASPAANRGVRLPLCKPPADLPGTLGTQTPNATDRSNSRNSSKSELPCPIFDRNEIGYASYPTLQDWRTLNVFSESKQRFDPGMKYSGEHNDPNW